PALRLRFAKSCVPWDTGWPPSPIPTWTSARASSSSRRTTATWRRPIRGVTARPRDSERAGSRMKRAVIWSIVALAVVAGVLLVPLPWPAGLVGTRLENSVDIAAPAPQVFAYVATPANWPRWHPASRAVRGVTDGT